MERNRNKFVDGGVNGLTAGVVLDMHGNVTDKQAGFPGPLTQCEPQTSGVHTDIQTHERMRSVCTVTGCHNSCHPAQGRTHIPVDLGHICSMVVDLFSYCWGENLVPNHAKYIR